MAGAAERLAAIVEWSDDAIVSKNLDGIITSWNGAAERIFGYTAAEAIGRSIHLIIPIDRDSEEDVVIDRIRRGEAVDHFETLRRRKDGSLVPVSLTVSPVRDATGTIIGASKIARDVSDRKRTEAEREQLLARAEQARADAERANRVKDDFLAMLSHELRSPLNAIAGWTHLAASEVDDRTSPTVRRALTVIDRNVAMQVRLINDLLDISSIANGKLRLRADTVDMAGVVGTVVDSMRPEAAANGIRVEVILDAVQPRVTGDGVRLEQVVGNLLSNALKFTPRDGAVTVTLERAGTNVRIVIQDTGEGIPPEFLAHVFDRFRQADATTTRRHGGLGLGLAVARYLVQAHGGSIVADSPGPGLGSTFTVQLPAAVEAGARSEGWPAQPARVLDGIRLLVVDDDADARDLIDAILRRYGVAATLVGSTDAAIEALDAGMFDVVLSDLAMPGRDGYELIEAIRRHRRPETRRVGAIAISARVDAVSLTRALACGFDDYLSKPVEAHRLIHLIENVHQRRAARVIASPPASRR